MVNYPPMDMFVRWESHHKISIRFKAGLFRREEQDKSRICRVPGGKTLENPEIVLIF